jgi:dolichol-phosphate mannosyltransferase
MLKQARRLPDEHAAATGLGVVIPLANEEATIVSLLKDILVHLRKNDRIFCVLDTVSRDRTRELVQDAARCDNRVCEVWAPENRCVVDAYFRGYRSGLDAGCAWILEMDGGYSHDPAEIPRFIEAMQPGVDCIVGSRFCPGGKYSGRWSRYLLSRIGSIAANLMLATRMSDMTSGFECFSRETMQYVVDQGVRSRAHFFQTEIRFMLRNRNWTEVPITYTNPSNSVGSEAISESLRTLWILARQARREEKES